MDFLVALVVLMPLKSQAIAPKIQLFRLPKLGDLAATSGDHGTEVKKGRALPGCGVP